MIHTTPNIDSRIPATWRPVGRSPAMTKAKNGISTGIAELTTDMLMAGTLCRAT